MRKLRCRRPRAIPAHQYIPSKTHASKVPITHTTILSVLLTFHEVIAGSAIFEHVRCPSFSPARISHQHVMAGAIAVLVVFSVGLLPLVFGHVGGLSGRTTTSSKPLGTQGWRTVHCVFFATDRICNR
jgi:hypothetical protein